MLRNWWFYKKKSFWKSRLKKIYCFSFWGDKCFFPLKLHALSIMCFHLIIVYWKFISGQCDEMFSIFAKHTLRLYSCRLYVYIYQSLRIAFIEYSESYSICIPKIQFLYVTYIHIRWIISKNPKQKHKFWIH